MMIPYEFDEALREDKLRKLKEENSYLLKSTRYFSDVIKQKIYQEKQKEQEKPIIEQIVDNVYASLLKLNTLILYDNVKEQVINYLNKNNLMQEIR